MGIGITTLSETPGLGTRITEDIFTQQFHNKSKDTIFKVKKDGGEIDAITGATISSRAVAQAITETKIFYEQHQEKLKKCLK